jgi:hypothetical protein
MNGSPETTNLLLTLLVIATALTPLLLIAGAVGAMIAYKRMRVQIAQELAPILLETRATLQQVQHVAASVRRRVDEVDRGVTSLQNKTARLSDSVKTLMGGTVGRVLAAMGPRPSRRAS